MLTEAMTTEKLGEGAQSMTVAPVALHESLREGEELGLERARLHGDGGDLL